MPAHNSPSLLTNNADIDLLLEPTRQMLLARGYEMAGGFETQAHTEVCPHLPVTRVWAMMLPPKKAIPPVSFRIRLYFLSAEKRDHCLTALSLSDFDASSAKADQRDIAAKFSLMVDVPLTSLLLLAVSPADNAARVAKFVEEVLSHANG